jgi:hypothetical protein
MQGVALAIAAIRERFYLVKISRRGFGVGIAGKFLLSSVARAADVLKEIRLDWATY